MMKINELVELLLPPAIERHSDLLLKKLEDLKEVILRLQDRTCSLRQAWLTSIPFWTFIPPFSPGCMQVLELYTVHVSSLGLLR